MILNYISITWHSLVFLLCYYPPLRLVWPFISTRLNLLYTWIHCAKFGWKWPSWFWVEDFEMLSICFHYVAIMSSWKNACSFILTNWNSILCAKFGWNRPICSEKDFQELSIYFHLVAMTPLRQRTRPFIWTNLNPLYPMILCSKFGWNWPSGSGEVANVTMSLLSPIDKGWVSSFEQTCIVFA